MQQEIKKPKIQDVKFFVIVYNEPTIEQLIQCGAKEYAFIKHDNDIKNHDTGELNKTHWHIYFKTYSRKTKSSIAKVFGISKEQIELLIQFATNETSLIRYLVHVDNPEKYQYDIKDIKSNMNIQPYFELNLTDLEFVKSIINDIANDIIKNFKEIVAYSISVNKLELVMKRAYFFKQLF